MQDNKPSMGGVWIFSGIAHSGLKQNNASSDREKDLNPGPPNYKSSALTIRPRFSSFITSANFLSARAF